MQTTDIPTGFPAFPATAFESIPDCWHAAALQFLLQNGSDAALVVCDGEVLAANPPGRHLLESCPAEALATCLSALPEDVASPWPLVTPPDPAGHRQVRKTRLGPSAHLCLVIDSQPLQQARDELAAGNRELKALARRLFTVQEDERRAISRDLHDDIGQSITAMRMSAHAAMEENDPDRRRDDLRYLLQIADQTVARLRDLSMLLRPPQLDALGLAAALRWQSDVILRSSGITADLTIAPLPAVLARETEQACFRIAQEALTNVVRHAGAQHVRLDLEATQDGSLHLAIVDDGRGFQPGQQQGLGLVVMRERAETAGGHLSIHSAPAAGTRIHCRLPLSPP